jgi:hypothetical protein
MISMTNIVTFPGARRATAADQRRAVGPGLTAQVHDLLDASTAQPAPVRAPRDARNGKAGGGQPSLTVLAEQMRRESQELAGHLNDLRAAVRALSEADLPGRARAMVDALDDGARLPRNAAASGM